MNVEHGGSVPLNLRVVKEHHQVLQKILKKKLKNKQLIN